MGKRYVVSRFKRKSRAGFRKFGNPKTMSKGNFSTPMYSSVCPTLPPVMRVALTMFDRQTYTVNTAAPYIRSFRVATSPFIDIAGAPPYRQFPGGFGALARLYGKAIILAVRWDLKFTVSVDNGAIEIVSAIQDGIQAQVVTTDQDGFNSLRSMDSSKTGVLQARDGGNNVYTVSHAVSLKRFGYDPYQDDASSYMTGIGVPVVSCPVDRDINLVRGVPTMSTMQTGIWNAGTAAVGTTYLRETRTVYHMVFSSIKSPPVTTA